MECQPQERNMPLIGILVVSFTVAPLNLAFWTTCGATLSMFT